MLFSLGRSYEKKRLTPSSDLFLGRSYIKKLNKRLTLSSDLFLGAMLASTVSILVGHDEALRGAVPPVIRVLSDVDIVLELRAIGARQQEVSEAGS
jgi:hypothetical protein